MSHARPVVAEQLSELLGELDGSLVLPGQPGWDRARAAWNLAVDQRPSAVVRAASRRDVVATVRAAARCGLRVAPQSTGHGAAALESLAGAVLLRLDALDFVGIDPAAPAARIGAGARWEQVTAAAAEYGLTALAGSAADVGVVGYLLGGGVSWLTRQFGFAAQSVLALEVVTADGQELRVDADHDPDLFWALRGGGGGSAIVTSVEIRLHRIREVQAGALFFPIEQAPAVWHSWARFTGSLPAQVTSACRMMRFPPLPELPPMLSGRSLAVVEVVSTLDAAATAELLAGLRALGPVADTVAAMPTSRLAGLHMDPPGPVPGVGDGFVLTEVTGRTIEELMSVAGPGVDSPLLSVELRHIAGAAGAGAAGGPSAVDGWTGDYLGYAVGMAPSPEAAVVVRGAVDAVRAAVAPWLADHCLPNFRERAAEAGEVFGIGAPRLARIKRSYDPSDLLQANHCAAAC